MKYQALLSYVLLITMALTAGTITTASAQASDEDAAKLWIEAYYQFQSKIHFRNIETIMAAGISAERAKQEACEILKAVIDVRVEEQKPIYEKSRHSPYQTIAMQLLYQDVCTEDAPK